MWICWNFPIFEGICSVDWDFKRLLSAEAFFSVHYQFSKSFVTLFKYLSPLLIVETIASFHCRLSKRFVTLIEILSPLRPEKLLHCLKTTFQTKLHPLNRNLWIRTRKIQPSPDPISQTRITSNLLYVIQTTRIRLDSFSKRVFL